MKDPIADFKAAVVRCQPNETFVCHVGALGADIASSPTLTNIQIFAYGQYLMGRVGLRQKRVELAVAGVDATVTRTEYSLAILQPVHMLDFDTARKTYLDNLKH